jgi:hypothetical protein
MPDILRLILLILFLPLIIVLIGPLLIVAVIRGQQQVGPITLDAARYNAAGRAGIFMLGLALWLLVWGGLAYLAVEALTPLPVSEPLVVENAPAAAPSLTTVPTATPTDMPSETSTATSVPSPTATATPNPTDTPPAVITNQPAATQPPASSTPVPTDTATSVPATETPSPTVTAVPPTETAIPLVPTTATRPVVRRSVSRAEQRAAIETVEEANRLLQQAIAQASDENLAELEQLWQGQSLPAIREFAAEVNSRYAEPFEVELEYIGPLEVSENSIPTQIVVIAKEQWRYGGPSDMEQENFEFIYTVVPQDDAWVVSRYTYRNLPTPTATDLPSN